MFTFVDFHGKCLGKSSLLYSESESEHLKTKQTQHNNNKQNFSELLM